MLEDLAHNLDVSLIELSYGICLIMAFPLAFVHRHVVPNNATARHIFSLIVGLVYAFWVFGYDGLHFVSTSLFTYLVVRYQIGGSEYAHYVVFVFNFLYLFYGHAMRVYYDYLGYSLDWTVPQMMLCIKLTAFAYQYYDGHHLKEVKYERARAAAIQTIPSPLEFFSFAFFFAGFLTGPVADYNDYKKFTDRTMFKETNYIIPGSWRTGLYNLLLVGIAFLGNAYAAKVPESYAATDEFQQFPFWWRLCYIAVAIEFGFFKYYFAFYCGEGACTVAGLSYNGVDEKTGEIKWDRVKSMNLWEFRTAHNGKDVAANWNIPAANWLKRYVYLRVLNKEGTNSSQALFITYGVSAVWHGLYPGYYAFFFSCAYFLVISTYGRSVWRSYFLKDPSNPRKSEVKSSIQYYHMLTWVVVQGALDYCILSFRVLSIERTIKSWNSIFWLAHVTGAVFYVFSKIWTAMGYGGLNMLKKKEVHKSKKN